MDLIDRSKKQNKNCILLFDMIRNMKTCNKNLKTRNSKLETRSKALMTHPPTYTPTHTEKAILYKAITETSIHSTKIDS